MLISNLGIAYPRASLDPVFLANNTFGDGWYYNSHFYAGVLGCMSRTFVCLPDTNPPRCYDLTGLGNLEDTDREHDQIWAMLYFSLFSELGKQLVFMGAEVLDAQSLLSAGTSAQIPNNQWKAEARQMFETVLARSQILARNIARGVPGEELPGQEIVMRPNWQGMYTRYKFRSVGWKNISVSCFLAEFFASLLVCVIGITREDEELWIEKPARRIAESRLGRLCASGITKLGQACADHAPTAWKQLCSVPGCCWSMICDLGKGCADHAPTAWKQLCSIADWCWSVLCDLGRACWQVITVTGVCLRRIWVISIALSSSEVN
jgi:hypothetical protein